MNVWIVGKNLCAEQDNDRWEFQGVFSTEEQAVSACRTEMYFVGPAALDEALPDERMAEWPGAYYPHING